MFFPLLLRLPQSPSVCSSLNELRVAADFDERRLLIRARRLLPGLQAPALEACGLAASLSFAEKKKMMEAAVAHWRGLDPDVDELARECWKAILGDVVDLE
eukprot:GHVT01019599.1.p2 GENE.GHVT01019599.1~~GHVT01019599.1.p2  ORF type:complete len:101 (-),score=33.35 GHVT01019599.1:1474-1776(-)